MPSLVIANTSAIGRLAPVAEGVLLLASWVTPNGTSTTESFGAPIGVFESSSHFGRWGQKLGFLAQNVGFVEVARENLASATKVDATT